MQQSWVKQQLLLCEAFRELSPEKQTALLAIGRIVTCKSGTVLFQQGDDHPGKCYIVLSGSVGLWKMDAHATITRDVKSADSQRMERQLSVFSMTETDSNLESLPAIACDYCNDQLLNSPVKFKSGCTSLASTATGSSLASSMSSTRSGSVDDPLLSEYDAGFGSFLRSMPPGGLFGDESLAPGKFEEVTAKCEEDTELFVVDQQNFEKHLQQEIAQLPEKRWNFLRKYLPGFRALPKAERNAAAACFEKVLLPKGHTFLDQGERAKKAIYIVSYGSVGLHCRDVSKFSGLPVPGARQAYVLNKGKVFGAVRVQGPESFTVQCATPCEVLCVPAERFKILPKALLNSINDHLAQEAALRSHDSYALPSTPSGFVSSSSTTQSSASKGTTPLALPLTTSRTHCIPPISITRAAWQDELDRIIIGSSRMDLAQTPPHGNSSGKRTQKMVGSKSSPGLSGNHGQRHRERRPSNVAALPNVGENMLRRIAQPRKFTAIAGPFL